MRTLCPNLDREDGLETVLEVPIPEETFISNSNNVLWKNMKLWMKPHAEKLVVATAVCGGRNTDIQLLLGVIAAPLIPLPVNSDHTISRNIKDHPIVSCIIIYIYCVTLRTYTYLYTLYIIMFKSM